MQGAEQDRHVQNKVLLLVININIIKQLTNIYSYFQEILRKINLIRVCLTRLRQQKVQSQRPLCLKIFFSNIKK